MKVLKNQQGLTLLELMISIVLVTVIILIVSGAMRLGYRSISSGERKVEHLERFRSSFAIIQAQVQSAIPLISRGDVSKRHQFSGSSDTLTMVTGYSIWRGQSGYVIVDYRIEADDKGMQRLIALERIVGAEKSTETVLFSDCDAIFFEYFFKDSTLPEGRWVDEWSDSVRLPAKIKFHLLKDRKEISAIIPMRTHGL